MKRVHGLILSEKKGLMVDNSLIIADLHLGIEGVLEEKGVAIPSLQIGDIIDEITELLEELMPNELIIAGDLKHEFSMNIPEEWKDVKRFIESVIEYTEVKVIRGNHDNFLQTILSKYDIDFMESYSIGDFSVIHGNKEVDSERIIMGHEHPSIKLRHEGGIYSYRAFLHCRNEEREVWVLPHFSPILSGTNILESDFISPVMKYFSSDDVEVYAIEDDIYYMGTLKILRELL